MIFKWMLREIVCCGFYAVADTNCQNYITSTTNTKAHHWVGL
jgi:hypothetical protein